MVTITVFVFSIGNVVIYQSIEWIREYITNKANKCMLKN